MCIRIFPPSHSILHTTVGVWVVDSKGTDVPDPTHPPAWKIRCRRQTICWPHWEKSKKRKKKWLRQPDSTKQKEFSNKGSNFCFSQWHKSHPRFLSLSLSLQTTQKGTKKGDTFLPLGQLDLVGLGVGGALPNVPSQVKFSLIPRKRVWLY